MDYFCRCNALGRIYKSAPTVYEILFQQPYLYHLNGSVPLNHGYRKRMDEWIIFAGAMR